MSEVRRLLMRAIDGRKQATVDCSLVLSMIGRVDEQEAEIAALKAKIDAERERAERLVAVCAGALSEVRKGTAADCERMLAHAAGLDCESYYGCDECDRKFRCVHDMTCATLSCEGSLVPCDCALAAEKEGA